MTRRQAIDRALPLAAIGVGVVFAIVSWVIVERWVYPALVAERQRELAALGVDPSSYAVGTGSYAIGTGPPSELTPLSASFGSSAFSVALWPFSIALAHVLAGGLSWLLRKAPLRVRLAILVGSVGAVWIIGWKSVGPPDIVSFLASTGAASVVLAVLWLGALGLASLRRSEAG